jgi:hypothetical protein
MLLGQGTLADLCGLGAESCGSTGWLQKAQAGVEPDAGLREPEQTRRSVPAQARPEPACLSSRILANNLPRLKETFRTLVSAALLVNSLVDFIFELLPLVMMQRRLDEQSAEDWSWHV